MPKISMTLAAIAILVTAGACGKKRPADALDENAIVANAAEPAGFVALTGPRSVTKVRAA